MTRLTRSDLFPIVALALILSGCSPRPISSSDDAVGVTSLSTLGE